MIDKEVCRESFSDLCDDDKFVQYAKVGFDVEKEMEAK